MRDTTTRHPAAPRPVPANAIHLATLDLRSRLGLAWRETVWLLREHGRDSLWAMVADAPDRAVPVAAADSEGTPEEAGARLLGGYIAASGAEPSLVAGAGMLATDALGGLLALRRAGWQPN